MKNFAKELWSTEGREKTGRGLDCASAASSVLSDSGNSEAQS